METGLALLFAPSPSPENRNRFFVKLKRMLTFRHDGHQAVNGLSSATRRHKRGFGV